MRGLNGSVRTIRTWYAPNQKRAQLSGKMIDILYIALSLISFVALIAYVRACAMLGREDSIDSRGKDER